MLLCRKTFCHIGLTHKYSTTPLKFPKDKLLQRIPAAILVSSFVRPIWFYNQKYLRLFCLRRPAVLLHPSPPTRWVHRQKRLYKSSPFWKIRSLRFVLGRFFHLRTVHLETVFHCQQNLFHDKIIFINYVGKFFFRNYARSFWQFPRINLILFVIWPNELDMFTVSNTTRRCQFACQIRRIKYHFAYLLCRTFLIC